MTSSATAPARPARSTASCPRCSRGCGPAWSWSTPTCWYGSGTSRRKSSGACAGTRRPGATRCSRASGRNLLSLDIGLPLDQVRPLVMALMNGDREEVSGVLPAVNRRGRPVLVTVTGSPLRDADAVTGVILVMEAREGSAGGETIAGEDETAEPAEQAV